MVWGMELNAMIGVRHRKDAMAISVSKALLVQLVFISFLLYLVIMNVVYSIIT